MRKISFSESERELINRLISSRLEEFAEEDLAKGRKAQKWMKRLEGILAKVAEEQPSSFSPLETDAICKCLNRNLLLAKVDRKDARAWLALTDEQMKAVEEIDCCTEIRHKCGFFKQEENAMKYDPDIRYSKYVSLIRKLKESKEVILSAVNDNDYYKVGFVFNDCEVLSFDLSGKIAVDDIAPTWLEGLSPKEYAAQGSRVLVGKAEAVSLLRKNGSSSRNESISFIEALICN